MATRTMRWSVGAICVLGGAAWLLPAGAEDASTSRRAHALYREGHDLAEAGRYLEACAKFEASLALDAVMGTEFNLADCWEHVGRADSAAAMFVRVADEAHLVGQDEREQVARDRAARLQIDAEYAPSAPQAGGAARGFGSRAPSVQVLPMVVEGSRPPSRAAAWAETQKETGRLAELEVEFRDIDASVRTLVLHGPLDPAVHRLAARVAELEGALRAAWRKASEVTVELGRGEPPTGAPTASRGRD